jgi:hypothetical protein
LTGHATFVTPGLVTVRLIIVAVSVGSSWSFARTVWL